MESLVGRISRKSDRGSSRMSDVEMSEDSTRLVAEDVPKLFDYHPHSCDAWLVCSCIINKCLHRTDHSLVWCVGRLVGIIEVFACWFGTARRCWTLGLFNELHQTRKRNRR